MMISTSNETAALLSGRARHIRIDNGELPRNTRTVVYSATTTPPESAISSAPTENDRENQTGHGTFVKNRDRWIIEHVHRDGALTVRRHNSPGRTKLEAGYVAKCVELAYAGTAHAVQGSTVDIARTLSAPGTNAESFYVAMTHSSNGKPCLPRHRRLPV